MEPTALRLAEFLLLGVFAGAIGALTGIGGGLIITPVLTLVGGVPIHYAIGTSLCCVIATSSGAAANYIEQKLSDIRLAMTLELTTTVGAVGGAVVAGVLSRETLAVFFSVLLAYAGATMVRRSLKAGPVEDDRAGSYKVRHLPLGLLGSGVAGTISGLLG